MMIWGWIIGVIMNGCIVYNLAEMSYNYPVAGGIYHWSGIYSTNSTYAFVSYICGWLNFLGLWAGIP
jgi:amino acid transporter